MSERNTDGFSFSARKTKFCDVSRSECFSNNEVQKSVRSTARIILWLTIDCCTQRSDCR
ncbi:hypothetical protein L798_15780 [Zootermopsis nevadensis]|uniref:Uncharacterized protein n=1 Tax=Zootermopsis nevadensis TaxID=136037 RepID=A0A067QLI1_ZOONE|nr:hypothetical protein L798_15780 [Zootermopsis nevadensis]